MKLNQKFSQKLVVSYYMQRSLQLLSLSNEELAEDIQKELLENPLLEIENKNPEAASIDPPLERSFRLYDSLESSIRSKSPFPRDKDFLKEERWIQAEDLKGSLLRQKEQSFYSQEIKELIDLLISYVDEKAYLRVDVRSLAERSGICLNKMQEALEALQSFEPHGVGARSLEECLLIQIRQKGLAEPKLEEMIQHLLDFLKDKKYPYIAKELNISLRKVQKFYQIIKRLQPHPGLNFSLEPTIFIRPDLYIYKQGDSFRVIFNSEKLPNVKLSRLYVSQLRKKHQLNAEEDKYLEEKRQSALFFIRSLHSREERIKKTVFYIIKHQEAFFKKGFDYLKPLKMTDFAERLGIHISTVSRAVSGKYAHTPHGIVALKDFFIKGSTKSFFTGSPSIHQLKKSIKKWVEEEDQSQPLSDEQLKQRIEASFKISISRRMVSNHRISLNIPQKRLRKLSFLYS